MIINLHFIHLQRLTSSSRMACIADDRVFQKESKEQWLSPESGRTAESLQNSLERKKICTQARRQMLQYVTGNLLAFISLVKSGRKGERWVLLGISAQQHSYQVRDSSNLGHSSWGQWPYACLKIKLQVVTGILLVFVLPTHPHTIGFELTYSLSNIALQCFCGISE